MGKSILEESAISAFEELDQTKVVSLESESSQLISSPPILRNEDVGVCLNCNDNGIKVPLKGKGACFSDDEKVVHILDSKSDRKRGSRDGTDSTVSVQISCDSCAQSEERKSSRNVKSRKVTPTSTPLTSSASQNLCKNYWGILLSLGSGLASTFGGIIVKRMEDFHPFSLATYRFQGIVLPALCIVLYYKFVRKEDVWKSIWPIKDREKLMKFMFTIVRAVIGCLGLFLYFYAIKLMPLADAKIIGSCRPVFVTIVAHFFLGEPCGIFQVVASMIAIIGVAVISRPPLLTGESGFDSNTLMGTGFATLSMLAATLSSVVLRYLRNVHVAIVTLAFGFWGTLISIACSATMERFDVPQTSSDWILISCLALATFFSQTGITLAMKYEHAAAVVIVGTCDTIFTFVLQYLILGTVPDIFSIFGAMLIILCVSLITFRKWVSSLPESHSTRKRYWFVLK